MPCAKSLGLGTNTRRSRPMTLSAAESSTVSAPPKRLYPLRPYLQQVLFQTDRMRFKICTSGRRSGKTEIAKRRMVSALLDPNQGHPEARYFAGAPTRGQAKRIFWEDFKRMIPKEAVEIISETDLRIVTCLGTELWVIGLDEPARLEGTPWDGCVIDEIANCPVTEAADGRPIGIFDSHIRPALSDRAGWAILIGVPDRDSKGQVAYRNMVEYAELSGDPEWKVYNWPSSLVLPVAEVESARRSMDQRIFRQEFLGEFILTAGLAFPDFSVPIHAGKAIACDPRLPLCWACDFNIGIGCPACSLVIQDQGDKVCVLEELTLDRVHTEVVCDEFLIRSKKNNWNLQGIKVYGDATGEAKDSTSGISDWFIIRNRLKNFEPRLKVPRSNPPIADTVNDVNALIKSAAGEVRLQIDPKCRVLIENFRSALWPSKLDEWHCLAAFRYYAAWEHPIKPDYGKGAFGQALAGSTVIGR